MKKSLRFPLTHVLKSGTLQIGNLRIRNPFLLFAVYFLLLGYDSSGFFLVGLTASLWHELGHVLCYTLLCRQMPELTLSLAGISLKADEYLLSNRQVILLASSGPAANMGAALLFYFLMMRRVTLLRAALWASNFLIGCFNLLPVPPLDGFQILCRARALWSEKKRFQKK